MNGKLMFVLCRTCGKEMNEGECNHSETECELCGVWVVDEFRRAVELGYKARKIFEFWEYKVKQYDPNTKSGGVFTGYIDLFLKN
jgi:DNA-directed RNA polymerase subunit RPC12/RpoP